jgi:hypothetical protein
MIRRKIYSTNKREIITIITIARPKKKEIK